MKKHFRWCIWSIFSYNRHVNHENKNIYRKTEHCRHSYQQKTKNIYINVESDFWEYTKWEKGHKIQYLVFWQKSIFAKIGFILSEKSSNSLTTTLLYTNTKNKYTHDQYISLSLKSKFKLIWKIHSTLNSKYYVTRSLKRTVYNEIN